MTPRLLMDAPGASKGWTMPSAHEHDRSPEDTRAWPAARAWRTVAAATALGLLVGCGEPEHAPELVGPRNLRASTSTEPLQIEKVVYVPIYSSLYVADRARPVDMVATLSLRNMSESETVVVSRVDYYDSDGKLLREYVEGPHDLGPLQTAEFVIPRTDRSGGSGANFLVTWGLRSPGPDLLVEALMQGHDANVGMSFITEGRVVRQTIGGAEAAP